MATDEEIRLDRLSKLIEPITAKKLLEEQKIWEPSFGFYDDGGPSFDDHDEEEEEELEKDDWHDAVYKSGGAIPPLYDALGYGVHKVQPQEEQYAINEKIKELYERGDEEDQPVASTLVRALYEMGFLEYDLYTQASLDILYPNMDMLVKRHENAMRNNNGWGEEQIKECRNEAFKYWRERN